MADYKIEEAAFPQIDSQTIASSMIFKGSFSHFIQYGQLPLLAIPQYEVLDESTKLLKRGFDIVFSLAVMLLGMPIFLILMAITKITSKGPIFYSQERIGLNGTPFHIHKFRSMRVDAETHGPQLAKENDPRVTRWGRIMRKTRLDELPQFWNVLKGEMSVVGPRPERSHFIKQIVAKAPSYRKLLTVKPGITSLGQVNYGYAENVDEMCHRMLFDLSYLQDVTLQNDMNIILKTVVVMLQGRGK